MRTRTKIICTMGPGVSSYEKILELIDAGMNVARINMSHGTHAEHQKTIDLLKKAREEKNIPLSIMIDTKGPEIRVGKIKAGMMHVKMGQKLEVIKDVIEGDEKQISLTPPLVLDDVAVGTNILFDDGYITSQVIEITERGVVVEIKNDGIIRTQKGINIPEIHLNLPAITEQDKADIIFGCKNDMDLLAASFIRSAEHILEIKDLLALHQSSDVVVIAKIENAQGVRNFDSILQASDGIMVARGDLGVELPLTQVPSLQKAMIRKSYQASKSVVTATQMLESMIEHPRPTRAEVSDVANAVYDGTSAVMLSGETAIGRYPIEAVRMMRSTILEAEKDFNYTEFFYNDLARRSFHDIPSSVALASVKTAYSARGKAILALTTGGFTARILSRFRPEMPIIALTPNNKTYHQLASVWGVIPINEKVSNVKEGVQKANCFALKNKLLKYGDLIVITSGTPFGVSGTTNMMVVENIGNVLVRGVSSKGECIHGKITFILSTDPKKSPVVKDHIVVLIHCDESYRKIIKGAAGIILQNRPDDFHSEKEAKILAESLKIPLLIRADGARSILIEGQIVTLDPTNGLVFKGVVDCP